MKTTNMNFRIEQDLKDDFKKVCESKLQDMSKILIKFMQDYVKQNGGNEDGGSEMD